MITIKKFCKMSKATQRLCVHKAAFAFFSVFSNEKQVLNGREKNVRKKKKFLKKHRCCHSYFFSSNKQVYTVYWVGCDWSPVTLVTRKIEDKLVLAASVHPEQIGETL